MALRFFASGSFLQVIGDTVGLPKSTVSRTIRDVSAALIYKRNEFIHWPTTVDEIQRVKEGFFHKGGFPGVIGCVEGTHIRLQCPSQNEGDYVNRKGYHSINVQAIEQAFGWWKRRFHLLHSEIRMTPEKACILIGACATLHNIAILRNEPMDGLDDKEDRPELTQYCGPEDGKAVRDYIYDRFF